MKNIRIFYLKIFLFYNVFVMSYRAKKALHRVGYYFDKEMIKVSGVKIGLRFKDLYYNIEK